MMRVCAPRLTGECIIKGARAESARERRFWRPGQVATAWPDAPHGGLGGRVGNASGAGARERARGDCSSCARIYIIHIQPGPLLATFHRVFSFGVPAACHSWLWFVSAGARAKRMAGGSPREHCSAHATRRTANSCGYRCVCVHTATATDGFSLVASHSIVITARAPSSTPPCASRPQPALRCRGACP